MNGIQTKTEKAGSAEKCLMAAERDATSGESKAYRIARDIVEARQREHVTSLAYVVFNVERR